MSARRRGLIVLLANAFLTWTLTGGGAQADAFCRQLRTVIADAGGGFAAIRGTQLALVPDDGGGDDATRYATTLRLPGAAACGVDRTRADGDPIPPIYLCWFAPVPTGAAVVGRILGLVIACIGPAPGDRGVPREDRAVAVADVQRKDFVLSITAGQDHPVVLAISGK